MQGRGSDPDRAREIMAENPEEWAAFRPEVLGSVAIGHEGGAYTMALYFTSEQDAREGERKEPPPQIRAQMEEMGKLNMGEPEFLDLRQPWIYLALTGGLPAPWSRLHAGVQPALEHRHLLGGPRAVAGHAAVLQPGQDAPRRAPGRRRRTTGRRRSSSTSGRARGTAA